MYIVKAYQQHVSQPHNTCSCKIQFVPNSLVSASTVNRRTELEMIVRVSERHQNDSYCVLLGYDTVECGRRLPINLQKNTRLGTTSILTLSYITQEDYNINFRRPRNLRSCIILLSESHEVRLVSGTHCVDEECLKCNVKSSSE